MDASSQDLHSANAQGLDTLVIHQNAHGSDWTNNSKTITTYASCVLPVTFLNFKGQQAKNIIQLNWQTGSEVNASLFHLQRSINGKTYTTIADINAKGQSFNEYNYKDNITPIRQADIYYRLLEQDKDGKSQMSNTIMLALNKPLSTSFIISPNPASNKAFIIGGTILLVDIYDLNGRLFISQKPGADNSINVSQLPKGVYIVRIKDGNNYLSSTKLIVQ